MFYYRGARHHILPRTNSTESQANIMQIFYGEHPPQPLAIMSDSFGVLGDQSADRMAAACARTGDCDNAGSKRTVIMVAVVTPVSVKLFIVGGFVCPWSGVMVL